MYAASICRWLISQQVQRDAWTVQQFHLYVHPGMSISVAEAINIQVEWGKDIYILVVFIVFLFFVF